MCRPLVAPKRHVRRRVTELVAAPVAALDHRLHRERSREQVGCGAGVAVRKRLSNPARRDRLPVDYHRRHGFGGDCMPAPELAHGLGVPGAPSTEGEVGAGNHRRNAKPCREDVGHEVFCAGGRKCLVEAEHQHSVGARVAEQPFALVERRQPKWRHVRPEEPDGVRIEGGDDDRPALVETERDRPVHHGLMAKMESVEVAEREHASAKLFGHAVVEGEPLHDERGCIGARQSGQSSRPGFLTPRAANPTSHPSRSTGFRRRIRARVGFSSGRDANSDEMGVDVREGRALIASFPTRRRACGAYRRK